MEKGLNSVARIPSQHIAAPIKSVDPWFWLFLGHIARTIISGRLQWAKFKPAVFQQPSQKVAE